MQQKTYQKLFALRAQLQNKYDKRMLIFLIIFQIVKPTKKFHKFSPTPPPRKIMGNEFQEQYIPGLKNNQSRLFFAIVTIPLPKAKKKFACDAIYALYKA